MGLLDIEYKPNSASYMNALMMQEDKEAELLKQAEKQKEWLRARRGRFTASEFHRLMGYLEKDVFPKGAETYATEKAIESLTTEDDCFYTNDAMNRGNEKEVEAMTKFMEVTGLKVENYGQDQDFIELGKDVGCTPDGLIGSDSGVEGKAPNSKTHFFYLTNLKNQEDLKKHCNNYFWQIQGNLYVTGRKNWFFFSYDDRFKNPNHHLFLMKIQRDDEAILKLKERLLQAIAFRNNLIKQLYS